MSKRHPALIPIPDPLSPGDEMCIALKIPNTPHYRGMFLGALDQLTRWNSYERDEDQSALVVAERWRNIIDARVEVTPVCDTPLCSNGITLEMDTDDPDNTNVQIYDVRTWICPSGQVDVYMIRSLANFLGTFAHAAFRLRKSGVTVGGDIQQITVLTHANNPTGHIKFVRENCLGTFITVDLGPGADVAHFVAVEAQRFYIRCNDSFTATITIPHELNCTPA